MRKRNEQTMVDAVCIFATINNTRMWITDQSTRWDNKYLPHYTPDQEKAKPFEDEATARQYMANCVMITNRKLECEVYQVPAIAFLPGRLGSTIKAESV
jgi:hypothetical protein